MNEDHYLKSKYLKIVIFNLFSTKNDYSAFEPTRFTLCGKFMEM
jgi:hypothetical protein